MTEQYLEIVSGNNLLSAILHSATDNVVTKDIGVLILVGGPQYRVGSHRQFIKLSRYLASQGIPSLRLDSSGMGDSSGDKAMFYQQNTDINAGITALFQHLPQLRRVVLWGLCDAASAILLNINQTDPRIVGLILLNPWVRQEQSHAETMLKHYYLKRLFSQEFWQKIFSGGLAFNQTVTDFWQTWRNSKQQKHSKIAMDDEMNQTVIQQFNEQNYVQYMLQGWQKATVESLVITSGNDLTAQEFLHLCSLSPAWQECLKQAKHLRITTANHTFSSTHWRSQVEQASSDFVLSLIRNHKI